MHNLSIISSDADQLSEMMHSALLQPFWDKACVSDACVSFDAKPWLGQPMLFWKEALKALCHGMGAGMVKEKAVGELLTRLSRCVVSLFGLSCLAGHSRRRVAGQTREPDGFR